MFEIYQDAAGEYRWRFRAPNGRIMADSAEGYTERRKARRALTGFLSYVRALPEID